MLFLSERGSALMLTGCYPHSLNFLFQFKISTIAIEDDIESSLPCMKKKNYINAHVERTVRISISGYWT